MSIRAATHDDVLRIREIRAAVRENRLAWPEKISAADVHAFIDRCGVWVWQDAAAEMRGFSAGDLADGSVWALFVEPGHEGQGIGQALIARTCDGLRSAGHVRATLGTDPNTRAERFYRTNGWTREGTTANGEAFFWKLL